MNAADQQRIEQEQAESLDFSAAIRDMYGETLVTVIADDSVAASQGQQPGSMQAQLDQALADLAEARDIGDRTLIAVRQDGLNSLVNQARPAPAPRPDFGGGIRGGSVQPDPHMNDLLRASRGF